VSIEGSDNQRSQNRP